MQANDKLERNDATVLANNNSCVFVISSQFVNESEVNDRVVLLNSTSSYLTLQHSRRDFLNPN